jgi:peptidoglycan hydrolase-like protein with peptidoglycan-binding domain
VVAWSLGIGVGAIAAGAFVGFLVNGPPGHAARHRVFADVAPPTPDVPPPTAQEIIGSKTASAAPSQTPTGAPGATTVTTTATTAPTKAASMPLPPIPPAKPAAHPAPPSPPLSSGDLREVQGRLQSLGFDPGPLDGSAGPRTAAAITRYQQAHGLPETGVADKDMLAELRREPGATAPPPPPRPRPQTYQYAAAPPPRQSNPFLDALNRMFGR